VTALIARIDHVPIIVNAAASAILGAAIGGGLLFPRVYHVSVEYTLRDEMHRALVGAFVGWLIGCTLRAIRGVGVKENTKDRNGMVTKDPGK